MSNVNKNLIECLEALQKTQDYISQLETKIGDLEKDKSVESLLPYIQFSIYRPVKVFVKNPKCSKCDENGFVKSKDYFYNRFELCQCQKCSETFNTDRLDVFSTSYIDPKKVYDCVDAEKNLISVDIDFVYSSFSEEHLKYDYHSVFYANKEDCEKYCMEVNNAIQG